MNKEIKALLAKGQKHIARAVRSVTAGNLAVLSAELKLMKKAPR